MSECRRWEAAPWNSRRCALIKYFGDKGMYVRDSSKGSTWSSVGNCRIHNLSGLLQAVVFFLSLAQA